MIEPNKPTAGYPAMPAPPVTAFSSDRNWWWNGSQWLPAYSPDRSLRFDGQVWVSARRRGALPRWVLWSGLAWLVTLAGWLLLGAVVIAVSSPADPGRFTSSLVLGLAALAVLATCFWGFLLGRRRAVRWLWPAALVGTAVEMACYVVAMLAAPASDGSDQDIAAGAGLVVVTIPTGLVLLTLLWIGAGLGALSRTIRPTGNRSS